MHLRPKCTVSTNPDSPPRWRGSGSSWLGGLVLAAIVLTAVPAARADMELGHEGKVGRHRLVDLHDSAGAVCDIVLPGQDSLGETWLRINPPVMFARNRTPAVDEQVVGWQATVSVLEVPTGAWHVMRQSEIAREVARDDLAS